MSDLVLLESAGGVATLTLNRPVRHNSLIPPLLEALLTHLQRLNDDTAVRVVVLRAAGRSFSTGGDVAAFYDAGAQRATYADYLVGLLNACILALLRLPQTVVVAVQGIVTGGSLGLVLAGDVVLATPAASFTPYYGVVGFTPDGGWTALLPQRIGRSRTMAILAANRTISAAEALAWGLITDLVPGADLDDAVVQNCRRILALNPAALSGARGLLLGHDPDLPARLDAERRQFVARITAPDVEAGMADFLGLAP